MDKIEKVLNRLDEIETAQTFNTKLLTAIFEMMDEARDASLKRSKAVGGQINLLQDLLRNIPGADKNPQFTALMKSIGDMVQTTGR